MRARGGHCEHWRRARRACEAEVFILDGIEAGNTLEIPSESIYSFFRSGFRLQPGGAGRPGGGWARTLRALDASLRAQDASLRCELKMWA